MNPHVKCAILEFSGNGVLKSETPIKPEISFCLLARLTELGFVGQEHLAPEGWARIGGTGYLDQQVEEDFPEGKSVQIGADEVGRPFISLKFKLVDPFGLNHSCGPTCVVTAFQRYDNGGPWVLGGQQGPLERTVDKAGHSAFLGAISAHGFAVLAELIAGGRVTVRSWRQRPGGPVEYIYRTIELS